MRKMNFLTLSLLGLLTSATTYAKLIVPPLDEVLQKYGAYEGSGELDPDSIKVLVWNMYKGQNPSWKDDFRYLSEDKDILLLQEANMTPLMTETFNNVGFGIEMVKSFYNTKENNIASGVANASKIKPLTVSYQRSPDTEPFIKTPKMVSITEFAIKGHSKKAVFISIHAINFVSAKKLGRQLTQVSEFLKTWNGHVVFAGDFNTWSKKKLKLLHEIMAEAKLEEVKFDPAHDGRMTVFGNKIDYIFTKGFRHVNSRVYGELLGADHKALEVELAVKE